MLFTAWVELLKHTSGLKAFKKTVDKICRNVIKRETCNISSTLYVVIYSHVLLTKNKCKHRVWIYMPRRLNIWTPILLIAKHEKHTLSESFVNISCQCFNVEVDMFQYNMQVTQWSSSLNKSRPTKNNVYIILIVTANV